MSNKKLAILLGVLVLIFAISQFTGDNKSRSFDPNVLELDDSTISQIEITIPGEPISIVQKKGEEWYVSNGSEEYLADINAVSGILNELKSVKAKKVVARSDEKAANFDTDDDKATHIQLKNGDKKIADVKVGRFSFDQQSRQPISFIRKTGENETYLVQSFMAMSTKKDFNGLRDKSFVSLNQDQIQAIDLTTPSLSSNAQLENGIWRTDQGVSIDSTGMSTYLTGVSNINGTTFSETPMNQSPDYLINFSLSDGSRVTIEAARADDNQFILKSSQNHENIFQSAASGIYQKTFGALEEIMSAAGDL